MYNLLQDHDNYIYKMGSDCYRMRKEKEEEGVIESPMVKEGEEILTMEHLKFIFMAWAVGMGLGTMTFLAENTVRWM